ncbi:MAG: hypothetical protein PCFJNLEI_03319 [Verrucomicrobiae bacterium]|nr:hypothetical protein [Verrucomicrobiae bacterium]
MPLAKDLFDTFQHLDISENPWVLIGNIINYARDTMGANVMNVFASGYDIEEFHSDVEQKLLTAIEEHKRGVDRQVEIIHLLGVYTQLIYFFACIVNRIQNGPISPAHIRIGSALTPDDTVITFNWDCLMDRALATTGTWATDYGYGLKPKMVFRDGWVQPSSAATRSGPLLLKLHGSSNWITSCMMMDWDKHQFDLIQNAGPDVFYAFDFARQPYPAYAGRFMPGYEEFSYGYYPPNILDDPGKSARPDHVLMQMRPKWPWMPESKTSDKGLITMPLIIPPVKQKSYELFGELFSTLWRKAEDSLVAADHIIIIGYSFPRTDHKSVSLFKNAFCRRRTMPKVTIVDPYPQRAAELFHSTLGITEARLNIRAEGFSETSDIDGLLRPTK